MRFWSKTLLRVTMGLVLGALLGGCGTAPFKVSAMRFQETDPRQRTFQIVGPSPARYERPATYVRLEDYVRTALISRGFQAAPPGARPGMYVEIAFEQEPPRLEKRTQTESIQQWQPERTVLTTRQKKLPNGFIVTEAVPKKMPAKSTSVGSRKVSYEVKVFPKRLRIVGRDAVDAPAAPPGRPLWSVEVRNEDKVDDLDEFMVLFVAAAMDYLDHDFSGEKTVVVSPHDRRAKVILSAVKG